MTLLKFHGEWGQIEKNAKKAHWLGVEGDLKKKKLICIYIKTLH